MKEGQRPGGRLEPGSGRSSAFFACLALVAQLWLGGAVGCGGASGPAEGASGKRVQKAVKPGPSPEEILQAIYSRTADRYYALARALVAQEQAAVSLARQVERNGRRVPLPGRATGLVVDRTNAAIFGASVMITAERPDKVIGRGKTDQMGAFDIDLFSPSYHDLDLHVIEKGYDKWVRGRIFGGIRQWRVQLDQNLDRRFMDALTANEDHESRLWMLLEVVGARRFPSEIATVFPYIGYLRGDLLRVMSFRRFREKDDKDASPANRALELLAFWHDPEDKQLIIDNLPKRGYTLFKRTVIRGGSPAEVCLMWGQAHFAQTDLDPRPLSRCSKPYFSSDKTRALMVFGVYEAYRSYKHLLAIVNTGSAWELMLVKGG